MSSGPSRWFHGRDRWFTLALLTVLVSLLGCESKEGYVKEHREVTERQLEHLAAIYTAAAASKSIPDDFDDGAATSADFRGGELTILKSDATSPGNARIVFLSQLAPEWFEPDGDVRYAYWDDARWLTIPRDLVAGRRSNAVMELVRSSFEALRALEFVLVVRPSQFVMPKDTGELEVEVIGGPGEGERIVTTGKFVGGRFEGDALLFHVPSEKILGGFKLTVASNTWVGNGDIHGDFMRKLQLEIHKQAKAKMHAKTLPFQKTADMYLH
jgi:hypothetical protein